MPYAVFEEVSNVEGLNVRCISRNDLNNHLDVFEHNFQIMHQSQQWEKSYVHIDLDKLGRYLVINLQSVSKLSEISGFNWVKERPNNSLWVTSKILLPKNQTIQR